MPVLPDPPFATFTTPSGTKIVVGMRQPRGSAASPVVELVIGTVFTAIGTTLSWAFLSGLIKVKQASVPVPLWILPGIGGLFAVPGILVLMKGIIGLRKRAVVRALLRQRPDQPWLADFAWDPTGISDQPHKRAIGKLAAAIFVAVFAAPFHYWALRGGGGTPIVLFCVVFDLIIGGIVAYAVYLVLRGLKYGTSRLRFSQFPFRLGQPLGASLMPGKGIEKYDTLSFTLRCIQERIVKRTVSTSRGHKTETVIECHLAWADAVTISRPGSLPAGAEMPITFGLPGEAGLATELSASPPRYWELEVKASTPGVDYQARFLVPVYGAATLSTAVGRPQSR